MCIRDRLYIDNNLSSTKLPSEAVNNNYAFPVDTTSLTNGCLLYTSDAADERSSVDLGGRRIIKKKKNI